MSDDKGPRAWSECPTCSGRGRVLVHAGSRDIVGPDDGPPYQEGYPSVPCEVCGWHFADVDAARSAGREDGAREFGDRVRKRIQEAGAYSNMYGILEAEIAALRSAPVESAPDSVKNFSRDHWAAPVTQGEPVARNTQEIPRTAKEAEAYVAALGLYAVAPNDENEL